MITPIKYRWSITSICSNSPALYFVIHHASKFWFYLCMSLCTWISCIGSTLTWGWFKLWLTRKPNHREHIPIGALTFLSNLMRWSLEMDNSFPILYGACDYLSMLGLKFKPNLVKGPSAACHDRRGNPSLDCCWRDGVHTYLFATNRTCHNIVSGWYNYIIKTIKWLSVWQCIVSSQITS